jgi:hypothetical protein
VGTAGIVNRFFTESIRHVLNGLLLLGGMDFKGLEEIWVAVR